MTIFSASQKYVYSLFSSVVFLVLTSLPALALGTDALLKTLTSFNNEHPIQAELTITSHREREGRENIDGFIQLNLSENHNGFNVNYPSSTLALLKEEIANQDTIKSDKKTNSPTNFAMSNVQSIQLRNMLNVSPRLQRYIKQLNFVDESVVNYQGESALLFTFTINLETIIQDKKDRKNVKKFMGSYKVWTTPSGTPLEAKMNYSGSGSYLFIFKTKREQSTVEKFKLINNRLVVSEYSSVFNSNSTFGKFFETNNKTLNILPNESKITE